MTIISGGEFEACWKKEVAASRNETVEAAVKEIIAAVRSEGDAALRRYAARFDKSVPANPEVPAAVAKAAWERLAAEDAELAAALELAAAHIRRFALEQKKQFAGFEYEMEPGLFTGQRVIPVRRVAVYVPGGRFPLISSALMGLVPAIAAGVEEVFLISPPGEDGLPDTRILAAAHLAGARRIFALGGAQAIAALALGTETVPRVDLIAGPGNKYVAAAKRLLYGEAGIDFVAGPTDVLIISDAAGTAPPGPAKQAGTDSGRDPGGADMTAAHSRAVETAADIIAADMLAQAEHDPEARARALVPCRETAERIAAALERRRASLPAESPAHASLEAGGLIIIYQNQDEAAVIANTIAPEHLELQTKDAESWLPRLKNYGSLFIGPLSAEVLGDYSAGINHTLPTSGSARYTGGLSVRHFLKTVTTLRCIPGAGFEAARRAAETIARAEGLIAHAQSAAARQGPLST
ncbi:MAG: histidinol dehydrogenase [Treponema sp.]|jgi:histidinol dehydrogenase|nr:histidinol dehydrogenase [Treponema sp.]